MAFIVLGDVDFLHHGQRKAVGHGVVGAIDGQFFFAVGTHVDGAAGMTHAQNGVHGVDLVVPFHVTFDRRGRRFDDLLEEVVHLVV